MPILQMNDIHKSFGPSIKALSGVSLSLEKGDILGLCGENGAGKSTLMKILSGVHPHGSYEGSIFIEGRESAFQHITDAEKAGVAIIHQELNLIPEMTVMENIWLGRYLNKIGILNKEEMIEKTYQFCRGIAPHMDPNAKIKDLGTGERQIVEIIKAVSKDAKILILDEPTSSLTETETRKLISLIGDLHLHGLTAIYISHKLNEIFGLCNKIAVIRDGRSVGFDLAANLDEKKVISMMVGRNLEELIPKDSRPIGNVIFSAKNYTALDRLNHKIKKVDDASFELREGEILGFSGLIGAGRTELMTCIFGAYSAPYNGESFLMGKKITVKNPKQAMEHGIAYVPEERKINGLILRASIKHNITLSTIDKYAHGGIIDHSEESMTASRSVKELLIKISGLDAPINSLSGGNQQKCVLAKKLLVNPKILILDEPTRGIDVGAKFEIYKYIQEAARKGMSVIVVSSELPEILGLCDRVIVMHEGQIKASLENKNLTQEDIMHAAIGGNR